MAILSPDQQNALANESRLKAAAIKVAALQSAMATLANASTVLASMREDAGKQFAIASQEMSTLQAGAGPGLAGDFGPYSSVDQLMRNERFAGKGASVDYVKANPTCSEADAIDAWTIAGIAATDLGTLIVPPETYGIIYRKNLHALGLVPDTTWESQRSWILATPKEIIMGA